MTSRLLNPAASKVNGQLASSSNNNLTLHRHHRLLSTTSRNVYRSTHPFSSTPTRPSRSISKLVSNSMQVHARHLSAGSFVRPLLKSLRFPLASIGVGAGAVTAASYTLEDWGKKARELGEDLRGNIGKIWDTAASEWNALDIPEFKSPELVNTLSNNVRDTWTSLKESLRKNLVDEENEDGQSDKKNSNDNGPGKPGFTAIAGALAAIGLANKEDEIQGKQSENKVPANQLMILTKKLIEIRNILLSIDHNETLKLPSIVVIGSQSSGKSSVLEAIVGHEFLPKGNNMVTRRPIELTLVNTPEGTLDYGEFPSMGLGKIKDFKQIQKHLYDMNMAVPESETISEKPIELRIYSPNVPDLTLVDLPGYIQIETVDQPEMLKSKIQDLCEKYIRAPNIILAVCAADVDLANSPALRASRRVDNLGIRTIGVVTKMDLVDPLQAVRILRNRQFPLHLGYVGVVCKSLNDGSDNSTQSIIKRESDYFSSHSEFSSGVNVGTGVLRDRLMHILEDSMAHSLQGITNEVQLELEKAAYEFKVHYNDRHISAESYVAETMDDLKLRFKEFASSFGKPEVRRILKQSLDQQWINIMLEQYWLDPNIADLLKAPRDDPRWNAKFEFATSSLTKSGIGRGTTSTVVQYLYNAVDHLTQGEPYTYHPEARDKMREFTNDILRKKVHITQEQVENCIKPYKYEIEATEAEWDQGVKRSVKAIEWELKTCKDMYEGLRRQLGSSKLNSAIKFIEKQKEVAEKRRKEIRSGNPITYTEDIEDATKAAYHPKLLEKAEQALLLRDRQMILKMRLNALKSRQCQSLDNKMYCPEAFLNVVADKLIYTAVMFINIELLSEFFYQFPRELDNRLVYNLSREEIGAFARENPTIRKHLDLQERKEKLELVMDKLNSLAHLHSEQDAAGRRKFLGFF